MPARQEELIAKESAKSGFKGKVNAKCIECIYDEGSGGGSWRQQTAACTSFKCPLFAIRPMSREKGCGDGRKGARSE